MTNRWRKLLFAFLAFCLLAAVGAVGASAMPALPAQRQFTQPDGSTFTGVAQGDEYLNYVKTAQGDILEKKGGAWYYAGTQSKYLLENRPANAPAEQEFVASRQKARIAPAKGPATQEIGQYMNGPLRILVVLVDFSDIQIQYEANWANRIFGASNSMAAYYADATNGAITLNPAQESFVGAGAANDGVVRLTLKDAAGSPLGHPNMGGNLGEENFELACKTIQAAADYVDFANYDANHDGIITGNELQIMAFWAGYEASYDSGIGPAVWAHQADALQEYGPLVNGLTFTSYSQMGEVHEAYGYGTGHMATIGVMCHEFGHMIGLPDLYSNSTDAGLGAYSLMAAGSWGRRPGEYQGETPVYFDAYCLEKLGAYTPQVVNKGGSFDGPIYSKDSGQKNILRLNAPTGNEYYLIENRQFEGYDQGMLAIVDSRAQGGLAVYHVNPTQDLIQWGNLNAPHQMLLTLMEADESTLGYSRLRSGEYNTDAYYYIDSSNANRATKLSHSTKPAARWANNSNVWFAMECLSEPNSAMRVTVGPTFSFTQKEITIRYKGTATIATDISASDLTWTTAHSEVATVSGGIVKGTGIGTTIVKGADENGNFDTCKVTVKYVWWQHMIRVLLLGFLWY
jgi:M6 family metalloprotease-like protein